MNEKFTIKKIENDPTMQKFLEKKAGRTDSTKKGYSYAIKGFCDFTGKTPTEIFEIHRNDLRERKAEFDQWLNEALDDYVSYMVNSDYSYGGIKHNITKIKGFFHTFKLRPTPTPIISIKHVPEDAKYSLKVEDIRKAIKNSNPTYQTLFITQAQTGLSMSDALLLDVEDFILAVNNNNKEKITIQEAIHRAKTDDNLIGCFDLRRKKTTVEFYTFVGPETLRNIAYLLEDRTDEHLKPESPIFMKDTSRISKFREKCIQDVRLNPDSVKKYVRRMHKKRGIFPTIKVGKKERNYFRTHKLRKWFSNQLKFKANFNADDIKYLMGQKTGDVLEYYLDVNNYNSLKNNYRKALPYLAITEEIIMKENQEAIDKLEKENKYLQEKLIKIESDLASLKPLTGAFKIKEVKEAIEDKIK